MYARTSNHNSTHENMKTLENVKNGTREFDGRVVELEINKVEILKKKSFYLRLNFVSSC